MFFFQYVLLLPYKNKNSYLHNPSTLKRFTDLSNNYMCCTIESFLIAMWSNFIINDQWEDWYQSCTECTSSNYEIIQICMSRTKERAVLGKMREASFPGSIANPRREKADEAGARRILLASLRAINGTP